MNLQDTHDIEKPKKIVVGFITMGVFIIFHKDPLFESQVVYYQIEN
ncbi:MAG: hypothetical protein ACI9L9_002819 [Marivirga sp.]|jgi:hypothetical protein